MFDYLKKRIAEPSSWAGAGLLTMGLGELFKVDEAGDIAAAIGAAGEAATQGGEGGVVGAILLLGTGIAAAFMKDRD